MRLEAEKAILEVQMSENQEHVSHERLIEEGARALFEKFSDVVKTYPPVTNMRNDCVEHLVACWWAFWCNMPDWALIEYRAYNDCMGHG
jgi:hypothetical protein